MTAPATTSVAIPDLWDQAFKKLDSDLRTSLDSTSTQKRDVLESILKEIEVKRELAARKRWKFRTPNGDVIIVRDVLEKITRWINKFKEIGDIVAQYNPVHLSLPWAAIRFLLQTAVSEIQVFGAMVNDLEVITCIVARYRKFEQLYIQGTNSDLKFLLEEALTRLYSEILVYLSRTIKLFGERSFVRLLKAPFRLAHEEQILKIRARESEVLKSAKLTDASHLLDLGATMERLSLQSSSWCESLTEQKFSKILEWLSPCPYYNNHQLLSRSRLPNIGNWLLSHDAYMSWQNSSSSSMLLLHGITGSGKSMLSSSVVDTFLSLSANNPSAVPFAYFYCANTDSRGPNPSAGDVMRTILGQLALDTTGQHKIKDILYAEFERQNAIARVGQFDTSKPTMQDCGRLILELAEQDPLIIVIDGADSIEENDHYAFICALKDITSNADNVVKIFITTRSSNCTRFLDAANHRIRITYRRIQRDMEVFVNHEVENAIVTRRLLEGNVSPDLQSVLQQTLLKGAGEMFLWVKLQIQRLCREKLEDDVIAALQKKLPDDLDQLYQESFNYISGLGTTAYNTAVKALSWILYMREPLTASVLLIAISDGRDSTIQLSQLMALCADLIVLDSDSKVLRFIHHSVKEFLEHHPSFAAVTAHKLLALTCIKVCSRGPISTEQLQYPSIDIYVYAAIYWPIHSAIAEEMSTSEQLQEEVISFIFDEELETTLSFNSWLGSIRELVTILPTYHTSLTALDAISSSDAGYIFLICVFGLSRLLETILHQMPDLDVNQKNKIGHTPIYLAAAFGHTAAVAVLCDHGVDVNIQGGRLGSPLHAACFAGHVKIVDKLLQCSAEISCGDVFRDALQAACYGGQEHVLIHFISDSSIIRSEDEYDKVLEDAARAGLVRAIKHLQNPSLQPLNRRDPDKARKRLTKAIQGGQLGIIRQFLKQETSKPDNLPPDAVALATLYNHKDLVEYFIEQEIDIEFEGIIGTPLRTACLLNHQSIVRLLLRRGAEINACGSFGDALHAAAMKGHTGTVKLLIDEGADIRQRSGFYGSALQAASYFGHHDTVEILLKSGAYLHGNGYYKDAFHAAAAGGHQNVLMLMIQRGYRVHEHKTTWASRTVPYSWDDGDDKIFMGMNRRLRDWLQQMFAKAQSFLVKNPKSSQTSATTNSSTSDITNSSTKLPKVELESIFEAVQGEPNNFSEGAEYVRMIDNELRPYLSQYEDHDGLVRDTSAGHQDIVKLLLQNQQKVMMDSSEIDACVEVAALKSQTHIVQLLLDDIVKKRSVGYSIKAVLYVGLRKQNEHMVNFALEWASRNCSADEINELNQMLTIPVNAFRSNTETDLARPTVKFRPSYELEFALCGDAKRASIRQNLSLWIDDDSISSTKASFGS